MLASAELAEILRGMHERGKIYHDLIKAGLRTIDEVPIPWRDKTQSMIDADTRDSAT